MTAWHTILYCYEVYGPGKLSRDEENRYWADCKTAAQFQPIDLEGFPETRGQVQEYLDGWREKLSASEAAIYNINHILNGFETIRPRLPKVVQKLGRPLVRWSIIATYPRWMRKMMGVRQGPVLDAISVAIWKPIFALLTAFPGIHLWLVDRACPRAYNYVETLVRYTPAESHRVYTPAQARKAFGNPLTPLEQQSQILAKRRAGEAAAAYAHNHKEPIVEFASAHLEGEKIVLEQSALA